MRIIYFDIDCLRPDHLGCYGYDRPTSPNIDRIAADATRFEHYYCPSSPCLPSRTAWASGRFGIRNGVVSNHGAGAQFRINLRNYVGPDPANEMLMRQLRRGGLDTISFSNFADRHNAMWFMIGWSEFHTINLKGGVETADEVNGAVLPWLRRNKGRDNYFLHINYWDVHRQYRMDAGWAERFQDYPVTIPWPDEKAIAAHQRVTGPFTAHQQFSNDESRYPLMPGAINNRDDFEKMVTGYDAAIAYVDDRVGQVLSELDAQGVLDDSVIIVSADHGDAFGEHGIYTDHVCADECIHHIPMVVKWPGVTKPGHLDRSLRYNLDLGPTLCDILGFDVPEQWDGASFRENLAGNAGHDRDFLVWDHALYTIQRAVRTREHLMIRTYDHFQYNSFDDVALYDMKADPWQTTNLATQKPEILAGCDSMMAEWRARQLTKELYTTDPIEHVIAERNTARRHRT